MLKLTHLDNCIISLPGDDIPTLGLLIYSNRTKALRTLSTFFKGLAGKLVLIGFLLLFKINTSAQLAAGINVNGQPVTQGDTIKVCRGNSLVYTNTATNYTVIEWSFHLGTPASFIGPNPPPVVYSTNGIDSTIQVVSDGTDTIKFHIIIKVTDIHPVVDFTNNNNVCSGTNVQFNSLVTGTMPYTYSWTFGNGQNSTTDNPIQVFNSLGCGTVNFSNTLTVTDATGCSSTITHPISVLQAPNVQLADEDIFTPFSNCDNSPSPGDPDFTLTVNNVSPDAGCINSYTLDWGDGTVLTGLTSLSFPLTHTYSQLNAFNLVITAVGANGCSNSRTYLVGNQINPDIGIATFGPTEGCAPLTVSIIITTWQSNSPGTNYVLDFGDGSSVTLTHPINPGNTNDTIYHTYTTSSCPNSNGFPLTITATNACRSKSFTGGNIEVRTKPQAEIREMPNPYCVGENVCFTNETLPGFYINCITTTGNVWNFGDPASGSNNTSTGANPCHVYNTPGIYTVTLTTTNPCGSSTHSIQVCITGPPTPAFTLSNNAGCAPFTVAATNTTNLFNSCATATYRWSVAYAADYCGTTSSWNFAPGSSDTSSNPSFIFNNPGTYTVTLAVTNRCGTFTTNRTVTVKKPPVVTLVPVANNCGPVTFTPVANVTSCGTGPLTYAWTFGGGSPATSSNADPGPISFSGTGPHIISLSVTNECGTTSVNQQFDIDAVTISNAGPQQHTCGTSVTMAANTAVLGTGQWSYVSGPAGYTITTPSSPTTTITSLVPGTYVFQWTIVNGVCTSSSNVTIIIAPGPTPAAAGPDQSLCLATLTSLAGNEPIVGSGTWSYVSGPADYTITTPNSPSTTITGLVPGIYVFQWTTNFTNCTPSTDQVQITIFENPSAADAGTDQTICSSSVTMAGNTPAIGNGTWSIVNGPNVPSITSPASPSTTITGLIPGTYTIKWTINNGPCPPSEDLVEVIVTPVPTTAAAGPDQTICAANNFTLAGNTPTVGTGLWTYVNGPAGYTITDPLSPTSTVTGVVPGTYIFQWTITNGVCPPNSDQVQITINDNVTVANAGPNQDVCGSSITMAGNTAIIGTGLWTYVSGPAGYSINTPVSATTTISGLVAGTYIFQWTITNGSCASSSNVTITIYPGPTPATAGPDQSLCLATSTTLAANTPTTGTGLWTYLNGPAGYTITDPNSPATTVTGLVPGVYVFRWTTSFSNCTPSTDDVQISIFENPSVAVAGNDQTICSSSVTMAGNTPAIGNGTWTIVNGPNTPTIASPSSPATTITGLIPGTYIIKWTITSGPCPASEDLVQVNVNAIATTAAAGPDQILCAATSVTMAGNAALVGTGEWTYISGPGSYTIANASSPSTIVSNLQFGTYIFQWTITNGVCPPSTDQVQIDNLPALQNTINAPITTICSGQSVTINGNNPTGGTGAYIYDWEFSLDGVNWLPVNPAATTQSYTAVLNTSTHFRRKVSSLPCQTYSNTVFITVLPGVSNNTIAADQSVCINTETATIIGSTPIGGNGSYTFQWERFDGTNWIAIGGAVFTDHAPGVLTQTTQYRRVVSTALCSGPLANISNVVTITVNPDSKAQFAANPTKDCTPFNLGQAITVTPFPDRNALYHWYADGVEIPGSPNATGIFPGYTMNTPGDTVIIKLVTTSPYGCKPDSMQAEFITVATSHASFTKTLANGCGPLSVTFTNTSSIINSSIEYFWNFGNGILSNAIQPGTISYANSPDFRDTTYYITLKAFNGCDTTYYLDSVKVFPDSKARFSVDTTRGCSPFTIHILNTSPGNNIAYYWDFGDGFKDTTYSAGPLIHTYNTGVITTYTLTMISENQCTRDTQSINLVVTPNTIQAFVSVFGDQLSGCTPHLVTFSNSSVGASQLIWNFGDGSPIITTPNSQNIVTHIFNAAGVYNVSIRLQNDCSDTIINRTVSVYDPPTAAFSVVPDRLCTNQAVTVTNTSSNANSYEWFWGDATSSNFVNGQHNYTSAGVYTITLVAKRVHSSGFICTDTVTKQVTVLDKVPAQITVEQAKPCVPYTLNVNAGNITGYSLIEWFVYDSSTQQDVFHFTGLSASHIYTVAGTYSVKLIVRTTDGCADSSTYNFQLLTTPTTTFTPRLDSTCSHDTIITFNAITTNQGNNPVTYKWFVNGNIEGTSNPFSYHFQTPLNNTSPVIFNIQALAENAAGCGDTSVAGKILIHPLPFPNITVSPSLVQSQPDYKFTFNDAAPTNVNKTYLWDPGDRSLQTRNGREVTYTYGNTGSYNVRLFVTDFTTGCSAKDSVTVTILSVQGSLYLPNAFYPNSNINELKTFKPLGIGLEKYHLQIFDTWGKLVFETKELNPDGSPKEGWPGTFSKNAASATGKPLMQDAFVWKIVEAKFKNGQDWEGMSYNGGTPKRFGTITLFR